MYNNNYTTEPLPALKFDKKRYRVKQCPCGKDNNDGKFVPYIDHVDKGYCHSCGLTFLPDLPAMQFGTSPFIKQYPKPPVKPDPPIDFIPFALYQRQLSAGKKLYSQNHFIQWLSNPERGAYAFNSQTIQALIETYLLGNSGKDKYKGWVLYPFIDINGNLRDIKAMDYHPDTGKRIKEPYSKVVFIGKEILDNPNANTVRCFYGEHLLKGNMKPVKIFESEATATYAAPFFPEAVCIATGGSNGCKWTEENKCNVLKGRQVTLYPDIDAHESWQQKAVMLKENGLNIQVSELIINSAQRFSDQSGISYAELVKEKFDLRDILKYKRLVAFVTPPAQPNELPIITDPFNELSEIHTGSRFDNMILGKVKTANNVQYVLLFDQSGVAIIEKTEKVIALADYYNLHFTEMLLNDDRYLVSLIK